jgi:hypothetical protein
MCAAQINLHFGQDSLKLIIDSLQVDELISVMPQAVVLSGDFVNSGPFVHLSLGYDCNLHNLPVCTSGNGYRTRGQITKSCLSIIQIPCGLFVIDRGLII